MTSATPIPRCTLAITDEGVKLVLARRFGERATMDVVENMEVGVVDEG